MTSQTYDNVHIDGTRYGTIDYPLEQLSSAWSEIILPDATRPTFSYRSSSSWRGYVATWLIENDKLFLVEVAQEDNPFTKHESVDMLAVFGTDRVFADWFTGQLRCPAGKIDRENSSLYVPFYSAWRVFSFRHGVLIADELMSQESIFPDSDDY